MTRYVLRRTLPDGTVKRHSPQDTVRSATMGAARVLFDNGLSGKSDAQRFGARLNRAPYEELVHKASGYRFVVETVTEGS